jgi:hypothetical protein
VLQLNLQPLNQVINDGDPLLSINELFDDDTPASREPAQKKRKTVDDDNDE